jgi:hypothetical protein
MSELGMHPDPLTDVEPIGIGQHNVQEDEVRSFAPAEFSRAFACLSANENKTFFFQIVFEQCKQISVVFN